jgi:hypothetical protein
MLCGIAIGVQHGVKMLQSPEFRWPGHGFQAKVDRIVSSPPTTTVVDAVSVGAEAHTAAELSRWAWRAAGRPRSRCGGLVGLVGLARESGLWEKGDRAKAPWTPRMRPKSNRRACAPMTRKSVRRRGTSRAGVGGDTRCAGSTSEIHHRRGHDVGGHRNRAKIFRDNKDGVSRGPAAMVRRAKRAGRSDRLSFLFACATGAQTSAATMIPAPARNTGIILPPLPVRRKRPVRQRSSSGMS